MSPQVENISSRVCVVVAEAQEDFSQVENTQPVRLAVQDRQEFTATVADEPRTVGTHTRRQSFTIGSDTDSIDAAQADHFEGSDDGRSVSEVDDEFRPHEEMVEEEVALVRPSVAVMRVGFAQLDSWICKISSDSMDVCWSQCQFLWGSLRICLKIALEEILTGARRRNVFQQERGWKLFLLLPRMMFHRPPRGGLMGQVGGQVQRIRSRGQVFYRRCGGDQTPPKERVPQHNGEVDGRAARAFKLIQVGELSAGRHALEGADLADGNTATLEELRQRLANPGDPIPPVPVDGSMFNLEERVFCRNVRSAR